MEKEYLSYLYNLDAANSAILGHFDKDGAYTIDEDIIKELIACNKLIISYKDDVITASATVGKYKLVFMVYIQYGEGGKKRAGLFLVEDAKMGFINKQLQTYIDGVVLNDDGNFMSEIKSRYHLYAIDESEGVDMANSTLKALLLKLETSINKYKVMIPVLIDADREYVARMLVLLKESGEAGRKLLEEFKEQVNGIGVSKIDSSYWRKVKLLLDKLLSQNEQLFDPFTLGKMTEIQKGYLDAVRDAKEPVKEQPKSAPKKKAPAKKKGGDDAPKKKPDGKKGGDKDKGKKGEDKKKDGKKPASGGVSTPPKPSKPKEKEKAEFKAPITSNEIFGARINNSAEKVKGQKSPFASQKDYGMER